MTGPGRPTTGTPVHIRIPADLLERIDAIAERSATTRAAVIRTLITERFAAYPYDEAP